MTKRNKLFAILLVSGLLLAGFLPGCNKTTNQVGVDKSEVDGLTTKTFFDESGNVEVTLATNGNKTIVAIPKTAIKRQNQLGPEEAKCLAKCTTIDDTEKRLNCILACPVGKYQMFTF